MNHTQESEGTARPEPGVPTPFIQRLFSWQRLRRALFVAACLATLIALFYAVENWRGRHAWEKCRRELEAKGEVLDWDAYIPPPVSDEQNVFKAPKMTEWFVRDFHSMWGPGTPSAGSAADTPFRLSPRASEKRAPVLLAEVAVEVPGAPPATGQADAVLRLDDPVAHEQAARLMDGVTGPRLEGARSERLIARARDQIKPLRLVLQVEKVPGVRTLDQFLTGGPETRQNGAVQRRSFWTVERAGTNGFFVMLDPAVYDAEEFLALSQPAVPDLDTLRQALERPLARLDGNYQRPYDRPVENFVRLRTVAQLLAQRAQCYLLLGQPEAAWHELALVRGLCHMLEAKPASDCPTLVQDMIDVAISGLYVSVIQDGLRLQVWREPELAAMQKQLAQINFIPLLYRGFQAERAASRRTIEITPPAELKRLWQNNHDLWDKLKDPTFLFLTFGPRGWLFQNLCAGALQTPLILGSLDIANNQVLPRTADGTSNQVQVTLSRFAPYTFLVRAAVPNFLKAIRTMARNQTLANEAYIACGLERYRLAHNDYPKSLEALVPQFAQKLPRDIIGGEPLKYERIADDRFALYSIGWNAKDDHGLPGKTIADGDWVWP